MQNRIPFSRARASVLIGCLFTMTLSACGGGYDSAATNTASTTATTPASTTTTAASAADVQVAALNRSRNSASTTTTTTTTTTPSTTTTTAPSTTTPSTTTTTPSTTTTTTTTTTNPLLTRTVRILCLGDSMTVGNDDIASRFRTYRGTLYGMLRNAGYDVDFVGTQKLTPVVGGDPDHDGYGGAYIGPGGSSNNLYDRLPGIFAQVDPDIVIMAFGWNSVYNEPSVAVQKYRDIVASIRAAKPNARLVLATLSPQNGETEWQSNISVTGYADYNANARTMANASATDYLYLADYAAGGFNGSEYWDVIHWLQPGADRAAGILYNALVNGPLKR